MLGKTIFCRAADSALLLLLLKIVFLWLCAKVEGTLFFNCQLFYVLWRPHESSLPMIAFSLGTGRLCFVLSVVVLVVLVVLVWVVLVWVVLVLVVFGA